MKKTSTKNATPKKAKVVTKKNQKTEKKKTPVKKEEVSYPSWLMPEHLTSPKDREDLKKFYTLYNEGKFNEALDFASALDTIVREVIPLDIWKEIGGTLTPKGEEELKETLEEEATENASLEGKNDEPVEIKFNSVKELEQLLMVNRQTFFGENTLLFMKKDGAQNENFPGTFLLDFSIAGKPRIYFLEVALSQQNLWEYFMHITQFFALMKNKQDHASFVEHLIEIIDSDKKTKQELESFLLNDVEISDLLISVLENKPLLLLFTNSVISEISLFAETYFDTWGKLLKTIVIQKFSTAGEDSIVMTPCFSDLTKTVKSKVESVKCTEEDHLKELPERIRNIYGEIKTALLETDSSIEFNPKKHYISVRKNKNLAFVILRKKNVDIVIMNPENDTRNKIKYHHVKTLPASVQKFWNGDCCTLVIENSDELSEVINLLNFVVTRE
jgi:predicted transport protein